ncbi:MAG: hydantoinase B/oxoprolinase family protein [Ectothiorhodospiraceae bacterium]|nr:hydantoinase B/oxoprolinase family protein [Ectothiorhodospiraceae bacterium]
MPIDKVTLAILGNHARAAAESMAYTLYRTAHSTFVKETEDFTTGLTTPAGATFATPTELGATWFVCLDYGNAIRAIDGYEEGDICLTNDPYSGYVCTHPPDLHLWQPIFHRGEVVSFAVGHIHNTDVGGAVPASLSRTLTEVHQEGLRIPPMKLARRGELDRSLLDVMWTNVRMPEQNWGDLKAQIAAMRTGERKVHEMIARFGVDTFRSGVEDLLDYAEAQARRVVRSLPDGEYFFSDYIDEDAPGGHPCRIALRLEIRDDEVVLDFSGSDPQLESSINMPTGGDPRHVLLMVGLVYVLYSLDRTLPLNAGIARVARCILPEGSVVNASFPAAVGMRSLTCVRLQGVIMGAFSQAAPDRLPAGPASGGPIMNVNTVDNRTGRRVVASIDPITGGAGGNPREDGTDGSGANSSFLKNTPVEINEAEVPIRILRYGLARDSAGAGFHRGGLATELTFEAQAPGTRVTARNRDRTRFTSWGIQGGRPGAPSRFVLNPGTAREQDLANTDILTIGPGDVVHIRCGGAGGWGSPLRRPAEAVALDVARGFVSPERALADYGVVVRDGVLDADASARERERLRAEEAAADGDFYAFGASRIAYERTWNRACYAALTEVLASVPVHWRFFVKHRVFERVEAHPPDARPGDGSEVRAAFDAVVASYVQLRTVLAAGAARR